MSNMNSGFFNVPLTNYLRIVIQHFVYLNNCTFLLHELYSEKGPGNEANIWMLVYGNPDNSTVFSRFLLLFIKEWSTQNLDLMLLSSSAISLVF